MTLKSLLGAATMVLVCGTAAFAGQNGDVRNDRREVKREAKRARRDLKRDKRNLKRDRRHLRHDRRQHASH